MDIKESRRQPRPTLIIDDMGPVPPTAGVDESSAQKAVAGSGIALAAALASELIRKAEKKDEIGPDHAWPDGKKRPHLVKTVKGERVWLTDEEYDQLVLAARHKSRANPQGPRTAAKLDVVIGEKLLLSRNIGNGTFETSRAMVVKIKRDGSLRLKNMIDWTIGGASAPGDIIRVLPREDYELPHRVTAAGDGWLNVRPLTPDEVEASK